MPIPKMTKSPSKSSMGSNFVLDKIGLSNDDQRAPVETPASVMLTFEILMAPKKVIQCTAISTPQSHMKSRSFELALKPLFNTRRYIPMATEVTAVRL